MKYYKLMLDDKERQDIVAKCDNTFGISKYALQKGRKLQQWDDRIKFSFDPTEGGVPTDLLANNLGWFIASERLLQIITTLDCNFEVKPITVSAQEGKTLDYYHVLNFLDVVDAISLEDSEYSVYKVNDTEVYSVRKYALKEHVIIGKHIIRLLRHEGAIFVSEQFVNMTVENGLTGMDFLEVKTV